LPPLSNHLFLPVRPDWRDGKALIGYHNPLTGEYVRTDFLDFVIAAADDYRAGNRNAFFVILDEMNLARVEYYFADVLSVIESGRDEEGWTVEGIPIAAGEEDDDLPERLHLPPNLYIVGTVNMDETTHPFSPKVIDRAFTIELTDVDFRRLPPEAAEGGTNLTDDERLALLHALLRRGLPAHRQGKIRAVVEAHIPDSGTISTHSIAASSAIGCTSAIASSTRSCSSSTTPGRMGSSRHPTTPSTTAVLMKLLPKFNGSGPSSKAPCSSCSTGARTAGAMSDTDRSALEARLNGIGSGRSFDAMVGTGTGNPEDDWRFSRHWPARRADDAGSPHRRFALVRVMSPEDAALCWVGVTGSICVGFNRPRIP